MKCSNCCEKEATIICKECGTVFCDQCDQQVHGLSVFGGHSRTRTCTASIEACPDHGGRLKLLFCETCCAPCCSECLCSGQAHSGHKATSYDLAYAARKSALEGRLAELRAIASVAGTLEGLLTSESQARADRAAQTQAAIAECFDRAAAAAVTERRERLQADAEQRYAASNAALAETLAEIRAAEDASRRALAASNEPASGGGLAESLSRVALVEQSTKALSCLSDQAIHEALPASCTIAFRPKFASPQKKKDEEGKCAKEEGGCTKENPIVEVFEQFGCLDASSSNTGNPFCDVLKIKTVVTEDGKEAKDVGDTHVRLTWAGAPACYLDRAAAGKLVFALEMTSGKACGANDPEKKRKGKEEDGGSHPVPTATTATAAATTVYCGPATEFLCDGLAEHTVYRFVLAARTPGGEYRYWASDELVVVLGAYCGKWRTDCPRARVTESAPMFAAAKSGGRVTVVADTALVPGAVNRWRVRLVQSGGGWWEWVGVAPGDIDLEGRNNDTECGWYLNVETRSLYSGPPFRYRSKRYGGEGRIPTGAVVGVVMDMGTGTLSYTVDGVDMGVAYEGIPLDRPLFPAVVFNHSGQKVEMLPWE